MRNNVVFVLAFLSVVGLATPAPAIELEKLYSERPLVNPNQSAETIIEAAFNNLFGFDTEVRVETVTTRAGAEPERAAFCLHRKRFADTTRTLVTSLAPERVKGMRVLEIAADRGARRSLVWVPSIGGEAITTRYRLTDPFLGTFSDREASTVRADLVGLRTYEILSRSHTDVEGKPAHLITLRPLASAGYERVELVVASDVPVILEYRYYERGDTAPARVARAPRSEMYDVKGRWLPGKMFYRDRVLETETEVRLTHTLIDSTTTPDALFMDSSFYREPIAGLGSEGNPGQ